MGVALGWVAFALAGVAFAPPAERDHAQLTYTVRMIEADGVGWREAVFTRLKPVTRQGSATIWTTDRQTTTLLTSLTKSASATAIQAPKVMAQSGMPATIQCRMNRPLVTQVAFDGMQSTQEDMSENLRVGWHTTMIGRKLDQGILVQVVFEDTVIRAVHHSRVDLSGDQKFLASSRATAALPQVLTGTAKPAVVHSSARTTTSHSEAKAVDSEKCPGSEGCCAANDAVKSTSGAVTVMLDIPEVDTQEVVGEWLIPRGEVMLVSFGAHTVADKSGKAVVKERLAIIEADEMSHPATTTRVMATPGTMPMINASIPRAVDVAPNVYIPTPIMPSRSIPQGVHADGTPADLPPLPADETENDSAETESSEPVPSPQTKKIPAPKPAADTSTNKVEFSLPKAATMLFPSVFMPSQTSGFQFLLPMKPFSVKLPFGQKLEVEILGKIVPEAH